MANVNIRNEEKEEELQLAEIMKNCLGIFAKNWKWFLLSVVLCLVAGYVFLQKQQRVYSRQAVMLIEDGGNGTSGNATARSRNSAMNSLLELNGVSIGDNLKNEMFIITSHRIMERVVDSLNLDVDYTMKESLHTTALYRQRPFEIRFARACEVPVSFKVEKSGGDKLKLSDFKMKGEDIDGEKTVSLGQQVDTPVGPLTIERTSLFGKFPENEEVTVTRLPKEAAAGRFKAEVSASEFDKESSLIILSCNDINPERAEDILNEVFEAYKRDIVENKNRVAQSTADFIDSRISLIGDELNKVESRLADFKQQNRIIDFETNAKEFITQNSAARQEALQLESQVAVAKYLAEFMQKESSKHDVVPSLPGMNGASFSQPIKDYNELMLKRSQLVSNSSAETPSVREIDRQLASLRQAIISSIRSYVTTTEVQLNKARATENAITGQVGKVPAKEKLALDIQRQQSLKEALYTYLLNKREEVALQLAINDANVRMVEYPDGEPTPISPRSAIIMLVALVVGILIPSGIFWLKITMDITVSGRRDIEKYTDIPIAGELPQWKAGGMSGLITQADPNSPIVEAFRLLRHGLNFMKQNAKVYVATSTTPSQGKSFVSRNLAVVQGMTGKRVLLIDGDIRKRTLSHGNGKRKGLTSFLIEDEYGLQPDDIILKDEIAKNVDFMPAGMSAPNPAELLSSPKLDDLINTLRQEYDCIIIDTTPVMQVVDASIISRVADVTLYVIRVGVQEREFLPQIEKMYRSNSFHNLCIVINDSDAKGKRYGYGYYGTGYYGYGYGTPERKDSKLKFWKNLFNRKKD